MCGKNGQIQEDLHKHYYPYKNWITEVKSRLEIYHLFSDRYPQCALHVIYNRDQNYKRRHKKQFVWNFKISNPEVTKIYNMMCNYRTILGSKPDISLCQMNKMMQIKWNVTLVVGGLEEPSLYVITLRCKCTCVLGSECWVAACSAAVVVCPLGVYSSGSPK